jgi:hypothetical protein
MTKFPAMSVEEHYEQLLAFISTHIPTPFTQEDTEGAVIFTGGSPAEVIVRLTDTAVIVEEYAVRWEALYTPVVRPRRVGIVKWRRLPESQLMTVVAELIRGARDTRRSRYRTCAFCGKTSPPERMASDTTCRSCAKQEFDVVH